MLRTLVAVPENGRQDDAARRRQPRPRTAAPPAAGYPRPGTRSEPAPPVGTCPPHAGRVVSPASRTAARRFCASLRNTPFGNSSDPRTALGRECRGQGRRTLGRPGARRGSSDTSPLALDDPRWGGRIAAHSAADLGNGEGLPGVGLTRAEHPVRATRVEALALQPLLNGEGLPGVGLEREAAHSAARAPSPRVRGFPGQRAGAGRDSQRSRPWGGFFSADGLGRAVGAGD